MSVNIAHLSELLKGARTLELPFERPLVVLDTNVLLDILLFEDPNVQLIHFALQSGKIAAVGHFDSFYELADVISRPIFNLTESQQNKILQSWVQLHYLYRLELPAESYCKDQDDDKFFNLAKAVGAKFLLSKDKKVLKAKGKAKRFGCLVIKPNDF